MNKNNKIQESIFGDQIINDDFSKFMIIWPSFETRYNYARNKVKFRLKNIYYGKTIFNQKSNYLQLVPHHTNRMPLLYHMHIEPVLWPFVRNYVSI
jgi:hypothetical protein